MTSLRDNPLFRLELDLYGRGRQRWAMRAGAIVIFIFMLPPAISALEEDRLTIQFGPSGNAMVFRRGSAF